MKRARLTPGAREKLDLRLRKWQRLKDDPPPKHGWVREIREALDMTAAQLARLLEIKQPSVAALEKSETLGTIQLATLRRAAAALDCELVYALVPRKFKSLEQILSGRATGKAIYDALRMARLADVTLPNQLVLEIARKKARTIKPRRAWDKQEFENSLSPRPQKKK